MNPLRSTRSRAATATVVLAFTGAAVLAGCGADGSGDDAQAGGGDADASSGSYPVTEQNCGAEVTFDAEPSRVVLLKSASVPYLADLGVLDRVVARAGTYPEEYYDEDTLAALDEIPLLTDKVDTSGHLQISREVVISQQPDLVLGQVDNIPRESLTDVGINLLEEPALCDAGPKVASFDDVYAQMELYGEVFGHQDDAAAANEELKQREQEVREEAEGNDKRTAAVLYPTVGGGVTYAYGTRSMAQPQLEAAGFTNVFDDTEERVFEVSLEELLGRDPDVLVLLYSEGDPEQVEQAVTQLPGADDLTAVRNGDVMTQLFNYTEPPSPLAIEGTERIIENFGSGG